MQELEPLHGLSGGEAAARLERYGPNLVHEPRSRTLRDILWGTLREPMFLLLIAAATLYLAIGDLAEGIFLSAGALLSLSLVVIQEARSEHALRALNALAQPQARVVRDGVARTVLSREVVPGDIIIIGEGGRVPADALLIAGDALEVDESALTGESAPCTKKPTGAVVAAPLTMGTPGEELTASLFASTLIVRGQGVAQVVRTGSATEVGRIGVKLGEAVEAPTLVQRDIRRLIGVVGVLAVVFCSLVAVAYAIIRNDWLAGVLSGLTLAISLVPEEFPMVLAIFMALGGLRLARHNVLVRRSAVIETLGATTLLCVDKTGTLTENRMALRKVWRSGEWVDLASNRTGPADSVLQAAQLASAPKPHDAMDLAVHAACRHSPEGAPIRSYPLRPDFLAFVQVWPTPDGGVLYAAKGAHEAILGLCDPAPAKAEIAAHELGSAGMRVLAVATAQFPKDPDLDPADVHYTLEGLLGFEDPVRSDVPEALGEARQAGVDVVMITGDFPATALASAQAAGLSTGGGVVAGADLARNAPVPPDARIFARIMPEQKLQLIKAFNAAGHVTAMTGDGINDAPALAAADIGIAMGQRGTDVAREAADLILLDDRFASIVRGIALGRRIFTNLRRAMTYITAIHIPVAGLALLPILLGLPPLLYPMHLVLLELMIDPLCSIVFEGEPSEADAMHKPPRSRAERIFGARELNMAIVQGGVLLAAVLAFYTWLNSEVANEGVARAGAFVSLVTGHLSLALAEGTGSRVPLFSRARIVFWSIAAGAAAIVSAALTVPILLDIFRFVTPPTSILILSLLVGLLSGGWYSIVRVRKR